MKRVKVIIFVALLVAVSSWWALGRVSPQRDLISAILKGDVAAVKTQLGLHPELAKCDIGNGNTPLYYAAMAANEQPAIVDMLIAKGANPNAIESIHKMTPVLEAASNGHPAVLEALLKHGADPNSADWHGNTPLHWGASRGSADVVRVLLKHGAAVDTANPASHYTALHYAARSGNVQIIRELIRAGADVKARSNDGTPQQVAVAHQNVSAAALLGKTPGP